MLLIPVVLLLLSFLLMHLWENSKKPVYNNPVIFRDDGNIWLFVAGVASWFSFVGSFVWLAITSQ